VSTDQERVEAARLLGKLGAALASSDTEVEFYFVSGAVIFQAFAAHPGTAQVTAMFRPAETVRLAASAVAQGEGVSEGWLHRSVRAALSDGADPTRYVELPNVRAFVALPEYVLAIKSAAMCLGDAFREAEDLRFILRAMNLASAAEALSIVSRYFTDRQLASDTESRLQALITH
jgi:hypothetical protein